MKILKKLIELQLTFFGFKKRKIQFLTLSFSDLKRMYKPESVFCNLEVKKKLYPLILPLNCLELNHLICSQSLNLDDQNLSLHIAFGFELDNNFFVLHKGEKDSIIQQEKLMFNSFFNLANLELSFYELVPEKILVFDGNKFCSSKILDSNFLNNIQNYLGCKKLIVAIPRMGYMLIASDIGEEYTYNAFHSFHLKIWNDDSLESPQISNARFMVINGVVKSIETI